MMTTRHTYLRQAFLLPLLLLLALTAQAQDNIIPSTFMDTHQPVITHPQHLEPFFQALHEGERPVRLLHLGDSHVRGHAYTVASRRALEEEWGGEAVEPQNITYQTTALATETGLPGLVYHAMGVNGACCYDFCSEERLSAIGELQPDLIILSFGTNEAHGPNYTEQWHRSEMDKLVTQLYLRCPNVTIMFTTPPGSYKSHRVKTYYRGRARYTSRRAPNANTPRVVAEINKYASEHHMAVFDLYNTIGGEHYALRNWGSQSMLRSDGVHYTHPGYHLQGKLLAQALIKARREYDDRH